jgi:hypothetical protein
VITAILYFVLIASILVMAGTALWLVYRKPKESITYFSWQSPVSELEQWWDTTQSKDARILQLEKVIKRQESEIIGLKSDISALVFYKYEPVPTLSNPNKVMVLPPGASIQTLKRR